MQTCINLNVPMLGFVFYNKSPRNTALKDIDVLKKYNTDNISFSEIKEIINGKSKILDLIERGARLACDKEKEKHQH